jgi:outer membrane lipoprotein LolB
MLRLLLLLQLLLAGCVTSPPAIQPVARPAGAELKPFVLNGRIAIKHDGERSTVGIRWAHSAEEDDILLLAPFGQTVAHLRNSQQLAVLDTADKHYAAADMENLTKQVLGWHLPIGGLRFWVLALPAAGSKADMTHDANGQINVILQDGWKINYTRYAASTPDSLPLRITLQRDDMEFQILIDEWEIP